MGEKPKEQPQHKERVDDVESDTCYVVQERLPVSQAPLEMERERAERTVDVGIRIGRRDAGIEKERLPVNGVVEKAVVEDEPVSS